MNNMVNWNDLMKAAEDTVISFEPIPAGKYDLFVDTAEACKTVNGDKDQIKAKFKVESGPHANRVVWRRFTISPDSNAALGMFFRDMKVLGLDEEFFSKNPSMEDIASAITGKRCQGDVIVTKYKDQDRNDMKRIYPPTPGTATSVPPAPVSMSTAPPVPSAGSPAAPPVPSVAPAVGNGNAPAAPDNLPF